VSELFTGSGSLPQHQYVMVEPNVLGDHDWLNAVWFGLTAYPGRAWGCHLLLECGAIYRNVPVHQLASKKTEIKWTPQDAQMWDCYGRSFSCHVYDYLAPLRITAKLPDRSEHQGNYLFTCIPIGDAFTASVEQSKEFTFCALDNGRFTAQPTNKLLFEEKSFTTKIEWPKYLRRQTEMWRCEQ